MSAAPIRRHGNGEFIMCGIVGYIGGRDSAGVLLDGLRRLEYRGYDSAGLAVFENGVVRVVKTKGRLADLEKKLSQEGSPKGRCGIGHTRWATHGEPSDLNAHPQQGNKVTLVHNGIIENYLQLREWLKEKGYSFESETDTEVAAKLIDFYYQNNNEMEAITSATARIRGSYAFAILFDGRPDVIYAVRRDSPLIIGAGRGENIVASDIPAILPYTRDYYLLDEDEIAVVQSDGIDFFNPMGEKVEKERQIATWDIEAAEKGGFQHYMLKEICEQDKAVKNTVSPRLWERLPRLDENGLDEIDFKGTEKVFIVGCGTAMHAGMVGKNAIEALSRTPVEVDIASEFRYRHPVFGTRNLVIIISQSGETADTLAALRLAKKSGVKTLAIVNVVGSSIAREADAVLYTWAGPEIAVASTKAYSVQLSSLYLIAVKFGVDKGVLAADKAGELCTAISSLPEAIRRVLEQKENCQHLAAIYQNTHDLFFLGRGVDYAVSMEGSLKLKEISYVHSEAYPAGELKHGTISLIVEGMPVIAVATQGALFEKTMSNVREVKARGGHILLVCRESVPDAERLADHVIRLPDLPDLLMASVAVVPLQLFAYYMAVLRGCDVDKPRNLAKSVTVE